MLVMYSINPPITNEAINRLFSESWDDHQVSNFAPIFARSLAYVCAYHERRLVGFVNLAWDGGKHAFILDTTVHPSVRRNGIGRELVQRVAEAARAQGVVWLHVDYEPELRVFYESCGFRGYGSGVDAAGGVKTKGAQPCLRPHPRPLPDFREGRVLRMFQVGMMRFGDFSM